MQHLLHLLIAFDDQPPGDTGGGGDDEEKQQGNSAFAKRLLSCIHVKYLLYSTPFYHGHILHPTISLDQKT